MTTALILIIQFVGQVITLLVVGNSLASMLLPADNGIRRFLDRVTEPMLRPIRRYIKPGNGIDFAPLVLLLVVMILVWVLPRLILALAN